MTHGTCIICRQWIGEQHRCVRSRKLRAVRSSSFKRLWQVSMTDRDMEREEAEEEEGSLMERERYGKREGQRESASERARESARESERARVREPESERARERKSERAKERESEREM